MIVVKGVRRVGNNFSMRLLSENTSAERVFGGKGGCHVLPTKADLNNQIVVVIKNPYAWYSSIYRWAKTEWKWSDRRWKTEWQSLYASSYIHFYFHLRLYYEQFESRVYILNYETLLKAPDKTINKICSKFHLEKTVATITPPKKVKQSRPFKKEKKKFYLQSTDFGLSNKIIAQITDMLDWKLMEFYNYKPL